MEYLSRYYIDTTKFDVVIGFRADDAYFAFPKEFLNNRLTLESLSKIYSLGNLGKQFAIVSKKALKQLKYVSTEELEMNYHKQYISRLNEAKKSFNDILLDDNKRYGKTLWELIKEDAVIN